MPRNGSGTYSLPAGNPVVTGTTISSTWANNTLGDIGTALTQSIASNGQTTPTANLPMGGFKHTNVGTATNLTDYARTDQVQNGEFNWLTSVAGSDTITASASISPSAYTPGQGFRFVAAGANTGAVTLNVSGLGAKAVTKNGTSALVADDIPANSVINVIYDGTQFQLLTVYINVPNVPNYTFSTGLYSSANTVYASSQIQAISASVSSNALTISAAGGLTLDFRSTTLGNGTVTTVRGTPANLVISSGSTLGTVNAVQSDIVVIALNNAGTIELACVNLSGGNDLTETGLVSTTAEGGAGGADSANVIYSTTSRSNVAYRVLGIVRSTQATAGTWATAPSLIQGCGGQAFTALSSLGYGQTWQNVTGSRIIGTTYYNTTGRPIQVVVSIDSSANSTVTIGGNTVTIIQTAAGTIGGNGYFIVPAAMSYSLTGGSLNTWRELR